MENLFENTSAQIIKNLASERVVKVENIEKSRKRGRKAFVAIPDDMKIEFLPTEAKVPTNEKTFIDQESFVKYMNCYAETSQSRMFASLSRFLVSGIIDYQPVCKNPSEAIDGEKKHIAYFELMPTEDFKAWKEIDNNILDQQDFIQFLIERSHCVINPDQATILEIARKLEVKSNITFSGTERMSDGGINLVYREDIQAQVGNTAKIKVPDIIQLQIKAFEGGAIMNLNARLYYKVISGKVVFQIKMLNLHETVLETFREICTKISKDISIDIHFIK